MQREDWFWLAIKLAGLWLLLEGVLQLPALLANALELNPWGQLRKEEVLAVLVPLVGGTLVLLHGHRLVSARAAAAATATVAATAVEGSSRPRSVDAVALFWVACKVLGLYAFVLALLAIPGWLLMGSTNFSPPWRGVGLVVLCIAPVASFGAWLAFGERLFRLASRNAAKSLP